MGELCGEKQHARNEGRREDSVLPQQREAFGRDRCRRGRPNFLRGRNAVRSERPTLLAQGVPREAHLGLRGRQIREETVEAHLAGGAEDAPEFREVHGAVYEGTTVRVQGKPGGLPKGARPGGEGSKVGRITLL